MQARYGPPHRVYTVRDPATGRKVRQTNREAEARKLAEEVAASTGRPVPEVLSESPYFFVREYRRGAPSRRVSTGCSTLFDARAWVRNRQREGLGAVRTERVPLGDAVSRWLDAKTLAGRRPKTLDTYRYLSSDWLRSSRPTSS